MTRRSCNISCETFEFSSFDELGEYFANLEFFSCQTIGLKNRERGSLHVAVFRYFRTSEALSLIFERRRLKTLGSWEFWNFVRGEA